MTTETYVKRNPDTFVVVETDGDGSNIMLKNLSNGDSFYVDTQVEFDRDYVESEVGK